MKKLFVMMCAGSLLCGCAIDNYVYVAKIPVPQSPVFTVIPGNLDEDDLQLVALIQNALIKNNMQVIERPPLIMNEHFNFSERVDMVSTLEKTTADFIVFANRDAKVLKLLKKEKGQILISTQIDCHGDSCWDVAASDFVGNALMILGLIKNFKPEQVDYQRTVIPKH